MTVIQVFRNELCTKVRDCLYRQNNTTFREVWQLHKCAYWMASLLIILSMFHAHWKVWSLSKVHGHIYHEKYEFIQGKSSVCSHISRIYSTLKLPSLGTCDPKTMFLIVTMVNFKELNNSFHSYIRPPLYMYILQFCPQLESIWFIQSTQIILQYTYRE
jgi:hypothetical protein